MATNLYKSLRRARRGDGRTQPELGSRRRPAGHLNGRTIIGPLIPFNSLLVQLPRIALPPRRPVPLAVPLLRVVLRPAHDPCEPGHPLELRLGRTEIGGLAHLHDGPTRL